MTSVRNTGSQPVWFRDDDGKHQLDPGQVIEVAGDQHLGHALSLPGIVVVAADGDIPRGSDVAPATVEDLRAWLTERGVALPARASKAVLEAMYLEAVREGGKEPADDPSASPDGEAGSRPQSEPA